MQDPKFGIYKNFQNSMSPSILIIDKEIFYTIE